MQYLCMYALTVGLKRNRRLTRRTNRCSAISKHLSDMREITPHLTPSLSAQWLAREAGHLVIVAETMHTLQEGLHRSTITVVNKPVSEERR